MVWQSLKNPTVLGSKPRVLAGPILRNVTSQSVTVWFALKSAATVKLSVFNPDGIKILSGQRSTCAVGANLHIVAVTADQFLGGNIKLSENTIYSYNVAFDFPEESPPIVNLGLGPATLDASLAYAPYSTPSFCLPPRDVTKLRLIHGSCRKHHGEGVDALSILHELIAQTAHIPELRPHQLLLTGDQIYADDVAMSLLMFVNDAASALLGWEEVLTLPAVGVQPASRIIRPHRKGIIKHAGLTSIADNHLFTLGEYLCMYLLYWSDALWSEDTLPTAHDIDAHHREIDPTFPPDRTAHRLMPRENELVAQFRRTLPNVRRALANIPVYTMLDDHDVTDDFNMTREICEKVYGNALGRRFVQNALIAYSLCQHWGNVPEQFSATGTNPQPPGLRLLSLLDKTNVQKYETDAAELQRLVGVHDAEAMAHPPGGGPFAAYHDADGLTYHYTIEAPGHQIIVTDTRTCRAFPDGVDGPELLSRAQLQEQILQSPPTADRQLIVVLSTNAPSVPLFRFATRHPWASAAQQGELNADLYESWELPSDQFDRIFKALSDKLPLVTPPGSGPQQRRGGVVLLSGDIHSGFAARLLLTGTSRFEDPPERRQPVAAVFAQFISSSLRNSDPATLNIGRGGYDYPRVALGEHIPQGYAGWNVPTGTRTVVAKRTEVSGPHFFQIPIAIAKPTTGTVVRHFKDRGSIGWVLPPDYGYRLDYLTADAEEWLPFGWPRLRPIPPGSTPEERAQVMDAFRLVSGNYRIYRSSSKQTREIVGTTNIGEITFQFAAGDARLARQTLRWINQIDGLNAAMFTTYTVPLNPEHNDYKYDEVAPKQAQS